MEFIAVLHMTNLLWETLHLILLNKLLSFFLS